MEPRQLRRSELRVPAGLGGRVDHTDQEGASFFSRNGTARTDFSYALSDTVVLPKAGFRKELGPHHTVGFTFQRGFHTGGAGVQRSTGRVFDFDPEYAWNYELSYTGRLFDNRLAFSTNVFYLDLEDQQIETLADPLDPASAFTDNAAESHAVGFELEGRGRLPFGLSGFFSVGFVDTEFDTFNLAGRDLSGEAFPEAPRWNVAAGAFYQHPSGVFLGVDFEYTDDFRARIAQAPTDTLDDFFLTNVQAGYRSSWFVLKLFIDNVADRRYFLIRRQRCGLDPRGRTVDRRLARRLLRQPGVMGAARAVLALSLLVPGGGFARAAGIKTVHRDIGGAYVLIADGALATIGTFGHAAACRTTPVTPDTLFRVGSISKTVTSLLALALVEDGRFDLTTPVSALLPAAARLHGWPDDLRLVHLLEHAGRLPGSSFYEYARTGPNVSPADYLAGMWGRLRLR